MRDALWGRLCAFLAVDRRVSLAQATSLVAGLLSVGGVEVAATLAASVATRYAPLTNSTSPPPPPPADDDDTFHGAPRHLVRLLQAFESSLASTGHDVDGDHLLSLSVALHTLLEASQPVILPEPHVTPVADCGGADGHGWATAVLQTRRLLVVALDAAIARCRRPAPAPARSAVCPFAWTDPLAGHGARGLFLLAYSGAALAAALVHPDASAPVPWGWDWAVPQRYHTLVQLAAPHWPWSWSFPPPSEQPSRPSKRRRRVGFFSAFFYAHPVGRLLADVIAALDPALLDVYVITTLPTPTSTNTTTRSKADAVTQALYMSLADPATHYITVPADPPRAVEIVRALLLDVLVFGDAFMDPYTLHFAALRSAPVQVRPYCCCIHPTHIYLVLT